METGLSAFITTITGALGDFTTTNLATILVAALGITCALAIAWFALTIPMTSWISQTINLIIS